MSKQYFSIKPCMFCDHGEAELIRYDKKSYGIKCKNCGMEYTKAVDSSAEEIVRNWNLKMETLQSLDDIINLLKNKTKETEEEVYSTVIKLGEHTMRGALAQYANPILAEKEKGAWERAAVDKYGDT